MLIRGEEVVQMHERIKACAASSSDAITVLILVAVDADAVAACAMLTKLLEQDEVSHKVKPLRDYGMLQEIFVNDIADDAELRNIVMLNCGSIINLCEELQAKLNDADAERPEGVRSFDETPDPECRWWILDSHRPLNLQNVVHDERICVVSMDDASPELEELVEMQFIIEDEEFADEEDEDEDTQRPAQRRRLDQNEYAQLSPDSRAAQFHAMRRLLNRYYSVSWYGPASSMLMYQLVTDLNRTSNPMLWLACVGLTDQLVHERVEYERYVKSAQLLQEEVAALNQEGDLETTEVYDANSETTVAVAQHIHSAMRLESVQELRLSLMRHWTLFDAMSNSPYIATRLGLWSKKGRDNLKTWLCRMGIPLEECGQAYAYMRPETRETLHEMMVLYGSEYGLLNLTYPSIRRMTNYGLNSTMTAADMVYCIDAQLEVPIATRLADDADAEALREAEDAALARAFGEALGMLTRSSTSREGTQRAGIERSKELLKGLITCGNRVLSAKQFEQLGDYFQVILRESVETDKFVHVQALTKLALFLADALRETRGGGKEPIPVLLAAPKRDRTHLVVAVLGSARYWRTGGRNSFGNAFHEAARDPRVKARVAHEAFDASVVVVQSDDLKNFLEGVVLNYDAV